MTNAVNVASLGSAMTASSSGNVGFNSGYGSVATAYGCRAWVNFNGQSTVAIRASGNVTSITDNGTGDYTVNFTTAMPDASYCLNVNRVIYNVNYPRTIGPTTDGDLTTTSCRFITGYTLSSGTAVAEDPISVYVSVFR